MSCRRGCDDLWDLVSAVFCAGATACALWAFHRLSRGVLLGSRVKAYSKLEDVLSEDEKAVIASRIASDASRI